MYVKEKSFTFWSDDIMEFNNIKNNGISCNKFVVHELLASEIAGLM